MKVIKYNTRKEIKQKFCFLVLLPSMILFMSSCKKLIDVKPPNTSINSGNVYTSDATAIAAITNVYVKMSSATLQGGGITAINLFPALSADELALYNGATNAAVNYYYQNALSSINLNSPDFWTVLYQTIYVSNDAIEGLAKSTTLTPAVKQQLTGEAKFIRAFCYSYLVNLYGDVPLALGTDYTVNSILARTPINQVYDLIIADLKEAQTLLSAQYLNGTLLITTGERVRPTKWSATALLARVYLSTKSFAKAETEASSVINNSSLFSLPSLDNVFLKNSNEAIWQLQPVNAGWNTEDAKTFILPSTGPNAFNHPFYLSSQLLSSFEINDQRKNAWVKSISVGVNTYYHSFKYKNANYNNPITEYEMVFRLGEQYLIRAEARAQQDKLIEAKADLNSIRTRAGLGLTTSNDKTSVLNAIQHEKQVELFTEWGHRWFDLKRTGTINATMSIVASQKGGSWNTNWQWYPIFKEELLSNPNLIQNAGY